MRPCITADNAMRQASQAADTYMAKAYSNATELFGKEYVEAHPEIMCEMAKISERDFFTCAITSAIYELSDSIRALRRERS